MTARMKASIGVVVLIAAYGLAAVLAVAVGTLPAVAIVVALIILIVALS